MAQAIQTLAAAGHLFLYVIWIGWSLLQHREHFYVL